MSATSGEVSIISFASVIDAPAGIQTASFTLVFSLTTGIIKKLLTITRNKKKNKIVMLAKSRSNNIEILLSQALVDLEISHEAFKTIIKGKKVWKNERKY